jgi:hypothetical protein
LPFRFSSQEVVQTKTSIIAATTVEYYLLPASPSLYKIVRQLKSFGVIGVRSHLRAKRSDGAARHRLLSPRNRVAADLSNTGSRPFKGHRTQATESGRVLRVA